MALTRENFMELEGVLRTVYDIQMKTKKDYLPKLFNMATSKRSQENNMGIGSIGLMQKWTGQNAYDTVGKRWKTEYRHQKWTTGLQFEREIFDFNEYKEVVKKKTQMLALSVHNTRQIHGLSVFNNAFDLNFLGADGKPLCAMAGNGHPFSPENSVDTQVNGGTLDMTPKNIDTIVKNMTGFTDDRGNVMGVNPRLIICGPEYRVKAKEIVGTDKVPYSADNTINVWNDELDYMFCPFITGKKWFLVDPDLMNLYLNWFDARVPKLEYDDNFDTEVISFKNNGMWSFGWDEALWVVGNTVA